ncbi:MAG: DUF948 domain-containing protein [Clostridia bacterium]|nr:DUF948 domain-containing protein [Clostridia bacterium]
MSFTVQISDIAYFIIFCLIVVVGVFLAIALYNLNKVIKQARKVIETNAENINKTMTVLPEIMNNVNDTTACVKENVDKASNIVETVEETVSEGIIDTIKIIGAVVQVIVGKFTSK